ncbi:hypothetical protein ACFWIB_37065 [Streptomyces sp. NPDC127051]|uniref:hypothetical protein n=1 Tax=Streptomyces sp. NPDC127051 TaxID=3347119 RepID=UPI0036475B3C
MTPARRLRPRPRPGAAARGPAPAARSTIQHSGKTTGREEHQPAAATTAHHERQHP